MFFKYFFVGYFAKNAVLSDGIPLSTYCKQITFKNMKRSGSKWKFYLFGSIKFGFIRKLQRFFEFFFMLSNLACSKRFLNHLVYGLSFINHYIIFHDTSRSLFVQFVQYVSCSNKTCITVSCIIWLPFFMLLIKECDVMTNLYVKIRQWLSVIWIRITFLKEFLDTLREPSMISCRASWRNAGYSLI